MKEKKEMRERKIGKGIIMEKGRMMGRVMKESMVLMMLW